MLAGGLLRGGLLLAKRALPIMAGAYGIHALSGDEKKGNEDAAKLVQDYFDQIKSRQSQPVVGSGSTAHDPRLFGLFSGVANLIRKNSSLLNSKDLSSFLNMVSSYTLPIIQANVRRSPLDDLLIQARVANYLSGAQSRQAKAAIDLENLKLLGGETTPFDYQSNSFPANPLDFFSYLRNSALSNQ